MTVSLGQILAAVRSTEAALVGEVAGYLVLGAADAAQKAPTQADLGTIFIDENGEVLLRGALSEPSEVEQDLRDILGWLLDEVRSSFPNLRRVAERPEPRGLVSLITELETALVPVNRRAARRSLSRLAREAQKSEVRWHAGVNLGLVRKVRAAPERAAPFERPEPEPHGLLQFTEEPTHQESIPEAFEVDEPDPPSSGEVPVGAVFAVIERNRFSEAPHDFAPLPHEFAEAKGQEISDSRDDELPDLDDEPTVVRASVFELKEPVSQVIRELLPAPRDELEADDELDDELESQITNELLPAAQEDFEFEVEFEDFAPAPTLDSPWRSSERVSRGPESAIPATLPSGLPPEVPSFKPSAPPVYRFRTVRPRSDIPPPSGPLLFENESRDGPLSDIGSLLAGLDKAPLPRDELYRALSALTESEPPLGACRSTEFEPGER